MLAAAVPGVDPCDFRVISVLYVYLVHNIASFREVCAARSTRLGRGARQVAGAVGVRPRLVYRDAEETGAKDYGGGAEMGVRGVRGGTRAPGFYRVAHDIALSLLLWFELCSVRVCFFFLWF